MTSFGWKKKVGAKLTKKNETFTSNEEDNNDDEVDWLSHAPRKRRAVLLLEDSVMKSKRLKQEGCVLAEAERYWEALKKWDDAICLTPKDATLHEMKAQVYLSLHEVYPAVQSALVAVSLDPVWWEAHQTLGRTQLGLGEVQLAQRCFSKAVHLRPDQKELWEDDLKWSHSLLFQHKKMPKVVVKANQESGNVIITELDTENKADKTVIQYVPPQEKDVAENHVMDKRKAWVRMRET